MLFSQRSRRPQSRLHQQVIWLPVVDWQPLEDRRLLSATLPVSTALSSVTVAPAITVEASAASTTVVGYTPAQVKQAYQINQVSVGKNVTANGAGQTIAIVDAYRDIQVSSDLATFDSKFGLPAPSLTVVNQNGVAGDYPAVNTSWDQEISLDVEWAHAIAPAAKIVLVEANSDSLTDLLTAVNYARNVPGVSVVSMSWGTSEFFGETSYDSDLTTPAKHTSEVFVAASGDADANEWPSVSPDVLSVGGTYLALQNSSGTYAYEHGWFTDGGGYSAFEAEPAWQQDVQESGSRTTPDVSFDADPDSAVAVYDSVANNGVSGWIELGGTSVGAPAWAGLVAIADQGRVARGASDFTTAGLASTLYAQYDASSSSYLNSFHDVQDGGASSSLNFFAPRIPLQGYDLVTGLGSPRAPGLESALVASSGAVTTTTDVAFVAPSGKTATAADESAVLPPAVKTPTTPLTLFSEVAVAPGTQLVSVAVDGGAAAAMVTPSTLLPLGSAAVLAESPLRTTAAADLFAEAAPASTTPIGVTMPAPSAAAAASDASAVLSLPFVGPLYQHFFGPGVGQAISDELPALSNHLDRTWSAAAAAAVAGSAFLWWWSEDDRSGQGAEMKKESIPPVEAFRARGFSFAD